MKNIAAVSHDLEVRFNAISDMGVLRNNPHAMSESADKAPVDYASQPGSIIDKTFFRIASESLEAALLELKDGQIPAQSCFHNIALYDNAKLRRMAEQFNLCELETELILLCVLVQLDGQMASLCAELIKSYQPSLELAAQLLNRGEAITLSPSSPLRYWKMLALLDTKVLQLSPLILDESVFHYVCGENCHSTSVQPIASEIVYSQPLLPSQQLLVDQALQRYGLRDRLTSIHLQGRDICEVESVACAIAKGQGKTLLRIDLSRLSVDIELTDSLSKQLVRDLLLQDRVSLLSIGDGDVNAGYFIRRFHQLCANVHSSNNTVLYFLSGELPVEIETYDVIRLSIDSFNSEERVALWRYELSKRCWTVNDSDIGKIIEQFDLSRMEIESVCDNILSKHTQVPTFDQLWQCCREQCRKNSSGLVKVIPPTTLGWQDLVLPESEKAILKTISDQVKQRYKVYQQWGVGQSRGYGVGQSALFAGVSGTGKTYAARIIASELSLDIYQVDLSAIMDKYIGETEKKLDSIFSAAESSGAILLFDEADALFAKRSDVNDSKDRYANAGVSYLLQRMEAYRGLSLLTTNLRHSLDSAFSRRLRFIVNFPLPGELQRQQLWRLAFPRSLSTELIDFSKLARLPVGGGAISSIALNAAFYLAADDTQLSMVHILRAVKMEFVKTEKNLEEQWILDWV